MGNTNKQTEQTSTDNNAKPQLGESYNLVGKKFNSIAKYKCHIVNVFKDEGIDIVTYKEWFKRKQRWNYNSVELYVFMIQFDHGAIWL